MLLKGFGLSDDGVLPWSISHGKNAGLFKIFILILCPGKCRFIEKFGTHIVIGVKMGGKDVVCIRQQHSSSLQPVEVQKRLKALADRRFGNASGQFDANVNDGYGKQKVISVLCFIVSLIFSWLTDQLKK